jgi:hypothetical protein
MHPASIQSLISIAPDPNGRSRRLLGLLFLFSLVATQKQYTLDEKTATSLRCKQWSWLPGFYDTSHMVVYKL